MRRPSCRRAARAFTLVELLVVFVIIAILIALTLPALGAAHNAVRKAETRTTMQDFQNAWGQYRLDNASDPGQFNQRDLGTNADGNGEAGLSVMENALLDLIGTDAVIGIVEDVDADVSGTIYPDYDDMNPNIVKVGVSVGDEKKQVYVNVALLGSGNAYFAPDDRFLVPQTNEAGLIAQFSDSAPDTPGSGALSNTAAPTIPQMPDLVDAFGTPILLWVPDTGAISQIDDTDADLALEDFILDNSDADDFAVNALFYPNANKAFLNASSLGRKQLDMTAAIDPSVETSLVGFKGDAFDDDQRKSFMALFGNPNHAQALNGQTFLEGVQASEVVPTGARGDFILQSAGIDGVYLSSNDTAYRTKGSGAGFLEFHQNFTDSGNNVITEDMLRKFDDVMVTSN